MCCGVPDVCTPGTPSYCESTQLCPNGACDSTCDQSQCNGEAASSLGSLQRLFSLLCRLAAVMATCWMPHGCSHCKELSACPIPTLQVPVTAPRLAPARATRQAARTATCSASQAAR
jgi:hypothetical protein